MKRISYLLGLVAIMLFATPLCFSQSTFTKNSQNFSVNVPGPVDGSGSTSALYVMASYNSDNTFLIGVISTNGTVSNTREYLDNSLNNDIGPTIGAYGCVDTVYNGDFAAICKLSTTNNRNVAVTGKVWLCIHDNYLYAVFVGSSTNVDSSVIDSYLNSFVFLK
jgi:hypothetical protein